MAGKTGASIVVVRNRLPQLPGEIRQAVGAEVDRAARSIEGGAKGAVPVRTGTLRRSITTQMGASGLSAVVAAGTNYAIFVERGTRRMPARPFLIPAFEREAPRLIAAVRKVLGGLR